MGPEEYRDRITPDISPEDEAKEKRKLYLKERFSKIMDDNPDLPIHAIIGMEEESGITACGVEKFCMPCFALLVMKLVINNLTMHNMLGHEEEIKKHLANEAFESLNTDGKNN